MFSALVAAFEKAKKKYQVKVKRMETDAEQTGATYRRQVTSPVTRQSL